MGEPKFMSLDPTIRIQASPSCLSAFSEKGLVLRLGSASEHPVTRLATDLAV